MSHLIKSLLEQWILKIFVHLLIHTNHFYRKFCLRSIGQPKFVLILDQTLEDIESFCWNNDKSTAVLAFDTTFNIHKSAFFFTQSAYQNLNSFHQNSNKHLWFPASMVSWTSICASKLKKRRFYQSVLSENSALENFQGQTRLKNCMTE